MRGSSAIQVRRYSVTRLPLSHLSGNRALTPRLERPDKQTLARCLPEKPAPPQPNKQQEAVSAPVVEATVQLRAEQPLVLPLFLLANLAVYGTGVAIALLVDGDTSNRFFFAFAKMNDQVRLFMFPPAVPTHARIAV